MQIEQEEEEKLEQNFNKFFDEMLLNDDNLFELLSSHVTKEMSQTCSSCYTYNEDISSGCSNCDNMSFLDENSMMFKLEFESRLKAYAFELFRDGSLMEYISERSLRDSSYKQLK